MKMCNVCFEKPYINTTMYYILFSIIAIASIILLPIGTKLREGAVSKRKSRTFGNVLRKQFDATTRQAHQHGEVVGAATPSAWERKGLARIRRENQIKDKNGKFKGCKAGTKCPNSKVCLSQADCVAE